MHLRTSFLRNEEGRREREWDDDKVSVKFLFFFPSLSNLHCEPGWGKNWLSWASNTQSKLHREARTVTDLVDYKSAPFHLMQKGWVFEACSNIGERKAAVSAWMVQSGLQQKKSNGVVSFWNATKTMSPLCQTSFRGGKCSVNSWKLSSKWEELRTSRKNLQSSRRLRGGTKERIRGQSFDFAKPQ